MFICVYPWLKFVPLKLHILVTFPPPQITSSHNLTFVKHPPPNALPFRLLAIGGRVKTSVTLMGPDIGNTF